MEPKYIFGDVMASLAALPRNSVGGTLIAIPAVGEDLDLEDLLDEVKRVLKARSRGKFIIARTLPDAFELL